MREILDYFGYGGIAVILLGLFVEITPVKIYPLRWLGDRFNANSMKEIKRIDAKFDEHIVKSFRNDILAFQESLLYNPERFYTLERWKNMLDCCRNYEAYIRNNNLTNGQVEEAIIFIRNAYQTCLSKGAFLNIPSKKGGKSA